MSGYIDIDKAIHIAIQAAVEVVGHGISQIDAVHIADKFEEAPTADVAEVRHGEWVSHIVGEAGSFDIYAHYCNECDFVYESGSEYGCKYCPNCGAKMYGERRTDNG